MKEAPLLRNPSLTRREPTRPSTTTRAPERTVGLAFHEAFDAAAALHNGVRVLSATIVRADNTDGLVNMLLDREDCPVIFAFISMAAEEGDALAGNRLSPETYEGDRDIGGTLEWRKPSEQ
jgi:hypothetical protein